MFRIPFGVSMLGVALFAFGCEKRVGEECSALCTDVFEDCTTSCNDEEECTITCEDDNEICLGSCDADSDQQD